MKKAAKHAPKPAAKPDDDDSVTTQDVPPRVPPRKKAAAKKTATKIGRKRQLTEDESSSSESGSSVNSSGSSVSANGSTDADSGSTSSTASAAAAQRRAPPRKPTAKAAPRPSGREPSPTLAELPALSDEDASSTDGELLRVATGGDAPGAAAAARRIKERAKRLEELSPEDEAWWTTLLSPDADRQMRRVTAALHRGTRQPNGKREKPPPSCRQRISESDRATGTAQAARTKLVKDWQAAGMMNGRVAMWVPHAGLLLRRGKLRPYNYGAN